MIKHRWKQERDRNFTNYLASLPTYDPNRQYDNPITDSTAPQAPQPNPEPEPEPNLDNADVHHRSNVIRPELKYDRSIDYTGAYELIQDQFNKDKGDLRVIPKTDHDGERMIDIMNTSAVIICGINQGVDSSRLVTSENVEERKQKGIMKFPHNANEQQNAFDVANKFIKKVENSDEFKPTDITVSRPRAGNNYVSIRMNGYNTENKPFKEMTEVTGHGEFRIATNHASSVVIYESTTANINDLFPYFLDVYKKFEGDTRGTIIKFNAAANYTVASIKNSSEGKIKIEKQDYRRIATFIVNKRQNHYSSNEIKVILNIILTDLLYRLMQTHENLMTSADSYVCAVNFIEITQELKLDSKTGRGLPTGVLGRNDIFNKTKIWNLCGSITNDPVDGNQCFKYAVIAAYYAKSVLMTETKSGLQYKRAGDAYNATVAFLQDYNNLKMLENLPASQDKYTFPNDCGTKSYAPPTIDLDFIHMINGLNLEYPVKLNQTTFHDISRKLKIKIQCVEWMFNPAFHKVDEYHPQKVQPVFHINDESINDEITLLYVKGPSDPSGHYFGLIKPCKFYVGLTCKDNCKSDHPTHALMCFKCGQTICADKSIHEVTEKFNRHMEQSTCTLIKSHTERKSTTIADEDIKVNRQSYEAHKKPQIRYEECEKYPNRLLPKKGTVYVFTEFYKKYQHPFAIYADFETRQDRPDDNIETKINRLTRHVPLSYCYVIFNHTTNRVHKRREFIGENAHINFIEQLTIDSEELQNIRKLAFRNTFNDEDIINFNNFLSYGTMIRNKNINMKCIKCNENCTRDSHVHKGFYIEPYNIADHKFTLFKATDDLNIGYIHSGCVKEFEAMVHNCDKCWICDLPFNEINRKKSYELKADIEKCNQEDYNSDLISSIDYEAVGEVVRDNQVPSRNQASHVSSRDYVSTKAHRFNKVIHYCPISKRYLGCAHNLCIQNVNKAHFTRSTFTKAYFHNLTGYDGHLIINAIDSCPILSDVNMLGENKQKIMRMQFNKLGIEFNDSYKILNNSLDTVTKSFSKNIMDEINKTGMNDKLHKELVTMFPATYHYFNDLKTGQVRFLSGSVMPGIGKKDHLTADDFLLMLRKNIIPYEYLTTLDRSVKTKIKDLTIGDFKSCLDNYEGVSKADFEFFMDFAARFKIETLGEYVMIYQVIDVTLLTDVMKFNDQCGIGDDGLCPSNYLTISSYSIDALNKKSISTLRAYGKQGTDMISDENTFNLLKRMVRGGICSTYVNRITANNPLVPETFDQNAQLWKFLYEYDLNSMYPSAALSMLPCGNFKDTDTYEYSSLKHTFPELLKKLQNIVVDDSSAPDTDIYKLIGVNKDLFKDKEKFYNPDTKMDYIKSIYNGSNRKFQYRDENGQIIDDKLPPMFICADLSYPPDKHDFFSAFPLFSTNRSIRVDELSPHDMNYYTQGDLKYDAKTERLICDLNDHKDYPCHYAMLLFALKLGVKITNISRIVLFDEAPVMFDYMLTCSKLRGEAKTEYLKDFRKLKMNGPYGKTLQNDLKHIEIKIVRDETEAEQKNFEKLLMDMYGSRDYNMEELSQYTMIISSDPEKVKLKSPLFLGCSILDISKTIIFHYVYKIFKRMKFKEIEIAYGDTDSVYLQITTNPGENPYEEFNKYSEVFDTSKFENLYQHRPDQPAYINNFNKDHWDLIAKMKDKSKANQLLLIKDENSGKQMVDMICLAPKMYSKQMYELDNNNNFKVKAKVKGVKSSVVKTFRHQQFENVLNMKIVINQLYDLGINYKDIASIGDDKALIEKYPQLVTNNSYYYLLLKKNMAYERMEAIINAKPELFGTDDLDDAIEIAKQDARHSYAKALGSQNITDYSCCDILSKHLQHNFKSIRHQINTIEMTKVSISAKDVKRYHLSDGIHSIPYGHKRIRYLPKPRLDDVEITTYEETRSRLLKSLHIE